MVDTNFRGHIYDSVVDTVGATPLVLYVSSTVPAKNYADLITWLKAHPHDATTGSNGRGSAGHLSIESTRVYLHLTNDWLAEEYRRAAALIDADTAAVEAMLAVQQVAAP